MYLYLIYIIRSYTIDQITAIGLGFDSHTYQEGYPWLVYQLNNQRLHVNMPEVPTNLKYIRYPNTQPYSNVIPTDYIHNVEGFCQSTEGYSQTVATKTFIVMWPLTTKGVNSPVL